MYLNVPKLSVLYLHFINQSHNLSKSDVFRYMVIFKSLNLSEHLSYYLRIPFKVLIIMKSIGFNINKETGMYFM